MWLTLYNCYYTILVIFNWFKNMFPFCTGIWNGVRIKCVSQTFIVWLVSLGLLNLHFCLSHCCFVVKIIYIFELLIDWLNWRFSLILRPLDIYWYSLWRRSHFDCLKHAYNSQWYIRAMQTTKSSLVSMMNWQYSLSYWIISNIIKTKQLNDLRLKLRLNILWAKSEAQATL